MIKWFKYFLGNFTLHKRKKIINNVMSNFKYINSIIHLKIEFNLSWKTYKFNVVKANFNVQCSLRKSWGNHPRCKGSNIIENFSPTPTAIAVLNSI